MPYPGAQEKHPGQGSAEAQPEPDRGPRDAAPCCPGCHRPIDVAPDHLAPPISAGTHLGPYYVQQLVGEGGMGRIFRAVHENLKRPVAIKAIHRDLASVDTVQAFLREARAMNRVRHPHVIEVIDIIVTPPWQGDSYYVMEWLEGQSLRARLNQRGGALDMVELLHIAIDAASAMEAVHEAGLVHCDLKPDNLYLLERDGRRDFVKIIDFGVVRDRTDALQELDEQVGGTPAYMAPEQANGYADHRTDIYTMGVMLYEMAVGRLPFELDADAHPLTRHIHSPLPRPRKVAARKKGPRVPRELERIILLAMAPGPAKRYQRMADLRADLEAVLAHVKTSPLRALVRWVDWGLVLRYAAWATIALLIWRYRVPILDQLDPRPPPAVRYIPVEEALTVEVRVDSKPQAAEVLYDGDVLGETPCVIRLPEGRRVLEVRRAGYKTSFVPVDVQVGAQVRLRLQR